MEESFTEIRLHKSKPPQEFLCELIHLEKEYLVLRYLSHSAAHINGVLIEKGSTTIAHYWKDKNYVLWKMKDPRGKLIGHLFHICKDMRIGSNALSYEDLELDIWCDPHDKVTVLDQDEVEEAFASGFIDTQERALIENQKDEIMNSYQQIIKNLWPEEHGNP